MAVQLTDTPPSLAAFKKHATKFGPECVYETAMECGLYPAELADLAQHMRDMPLDPRWPKRAVWNLSVEERHRLWAALREQHSRRWLSTKLDVTERTLQRWEEASDTPNEGDSTA